jgi:hypothetical protein
MLECLDNLSEPHIENVGTPHCWHLGVVKYSLHFMFVGTNKHVSGDWLNETVIVESYYWNEAIVCVGKEKKGRR